LYAGLDLPQKSVDVRLAKEQRMKTEKSKAMPGIGDAAVKAKTGKIWSEWFVILDKAGAKKMDHKEIVAYVSERYSVEPWWRQMVAVTYEQARGLRAKHEKPEGYEISVSRILGVPVSAAYRAWNDARLRGRWLGEKGMTIRKATPDKGLRMTWVDGKTSVEVSLYPKGESKSQVVVQHRKLPSAKEASAKKTYWAEKLTGLREMLEARAMHRKRQGWPLEPLEPGS
jgi:uncharacterized protein YndB with AHSA1/START domain